MYREILFKAKQKNNSEWIMGYLFDDGSISPEHYFIGNIVVSCKFDSPVISKMPKIVTSKNMRIVYGSKNEPSGNFGYYMDGGSGVPRGDQYEKETENKYSNVLNDGWNIVESCFSEINPDTICQYIGAIDKNVQKIFENDIVKQKGVLTGYIVWNEKSAGWYIRSFKTGELSPFAEIRGEIEVVGNFLDER